MSESSSFAKASPERTAELLESLADVRSRVKTASRPDSKPTLVAVSKLKPASDIQVCYDGGQLDFGENYVQELEEKARTLPSGIRWHFIGTFQSNKAKNLAAIPNLVSLQTLGSIKGATALNKVIPAGRPAPLDVLIQVNTSGEDSKSGLTPLASTTDFQSSELIQLVNHVLKDCPRLRFQGLMTIGSLELSLTASETEKNADFERLKETRNILEDYLREAYQDTDVRWGEVGSGRLALSMGMSSDFEAALKSGSDIVRVGTGIFGQRPKKATEAETTAA